MHILRYPRAESLLLCTPGEIMDGIEQEEFDQTLRRLAAKGDLDSDLRKALGLLLNRLPNLEVEPVEADEEVPRTDASKLTRDIIGDTESFIRVPTNPNAPDDVNPFRAGKTTSDRDLLSPIKRGEKIGRFYNLGLIGHGGMGEVYRVRDPDLNRRMVLKVLRRHQLDDKQSITRFLDEAQLTSQLAHPGIVPVHELGILDDGRLFFTMREVQGRTLTQVIDEYHAEFAAADPDERDWHTHFHGLIDIFSRVCEPVAYAHSRGIIHRDLKPSNIMIGNFGEVQLLDWGLAKIMEQGHLDRRDDGGHGLGDEVSELNSIRSDKSIYETHRGSIVGTPAFMPPEQARGALDDLGPRSDVYALGAILYMVLDGTPPFDGPSVATILFQVIEGVEQHPGADTGAPQDLIDLCLRAMAINSADRPADAADFAELLSHWRDGSNRRGKAFELIAEADELIPEFEMLRDRARHLQREARRMLRTVPRSAPLSKKRPAWSLQEEADLLEREAGIHRARIIQLLDNALSFDPDLDEAHDRLADIYRRDHGAAERQRNLPLADSLEVFIRAHNTGHYDSYLAGLGSLTLSTSPPGARVRIYRYLKRERRLTPGLERIFGYTPITDSSLPMGGYLLEIEATGRTTVRYPVFIGRQETWTGTPPNSEKPYRVSLPFDDEIDDDELYVPGSYFWRGGDELAPQSPPRSVRWVDPFIIQKCPVSHAEYLEFLNDLVDRGDLEKAESHCPRSAGNVGYGEGTWVYTRDENGYFQVQSMDEDFLRLPVNLINWHSARAYARWYSSKAKRRWRLPTSDEWEKAARGVDGRFFPWGDFHDPTWCRMVDSTEDRPGPVPVDASTDDISPYGMLGAAGNIRDWCLPDDVDDLNSIDDETPVPYRGGCWFSTQTTCRIATREFAPSQSRSSGTGIRLARDYLK